MGADAAPRPERAKKARLSEELEQALAVRTELLERSEQARERAQRRLRRLQRE
jgi:hypothetical protein